MTSNQPLEPMTEPSQMEHIPEQTPPFVLPDPEDQAGWNTLYRTLGQPETPEGYTLPEGNLPADPKMQEWFKRSAHGAGLSERQATSLARAWEEYLRQEQESLQATSLQASEEGVHALKKEWGAGFDDRIDQARRAVAHCRMSSEELDALETALGTKAMLSLCARLGQAVSEPKLVTPVKGSGQNNGRDAAGQRIQALKNDPAFMTRYLNGDKGALAQMQQAMCEVYAP